MNLSDFRCMRQGVQLSVVKPEQVSLLNAIDRRNGKKQKALLVLHGFSSSPAVFRELQTGFEGYDAIVIPVLPGHASNLEEFTRTKAQDWLEYVRGICATLINEYEQVDILGLSLGGLLACHLGFEFKLNHLYLLAPALDLPFTLSKTLHLARALRKLGFIRLRSAAGNIFKPSSCEIAYRQLPLNTIVEILSLIRNFQFTLPCCPTDVFLGCHDKVISSHKVAARFAGQAHIQIHWLQNSAHVIPLDSDIKEVLDCIQKNLRSISL
ncbi:carboxylesterase [Legionella birminghamensis]|uniref:Carboxylesterase n=1 Tax=Legionella birminghamensis TaxID=28083 RepID=A0A378IE38_9GAMM|nr:alpha/beta fold hydrolase [Legionella birminghamensis]KTC68842.1 carboxylesterase [Legionella birminghamensis]STX33216.1 carboxylesterase [Legionella birminghamensis]